jgi:aryl sulfotransferase
MKRSVSDCRAEPTQNINNIPGRIGEPLPAPPLDLYTYWRTWISRGWFPWESEGYPYWGNMHHTQTWWAYRHLPNILFIHYHDLKTDLAGEIRRVAEITVTEAALPTIMQAVGLEQMRHNAERLNARMQEVWQRGAQTFFFKGTNGRWQDLLSAEDLRRYDETATHLLPPACRAWLEEGRIAWVS